MFKKLLLHLKRLPKNRSFRHSLAHFSAFIAVATVFTLLTTNRVITRTPWPVVPPQYAFLHTDDDTAASAVDLERDLRMRSGKVQGLVFFTGLNTVAVLGDGLEHDYLVNDADIDEMRKLARAGGVPVVEKPAPLQNDLFELLPVWWWVVAIAQAIWLLLLLFARREKGEKPGRFVAFFETIPGVMNEIMAALKMKKSNFYLAFFIVVVAINAGLFFGRVYHNNNLHVLPPSLDAQRLQPWQVNRHLATHRQEFQRITMVSSLQTAYVVLKTDRMRTVGDSVVRDSTVMVARTVIFPSTREGKADYAAFVDQVAKQKVETKNVASLHETRYTKSLSVKGQIFCFFGLLWILILGFVLMLNWGEWKEKENPGAKPRRGTVHAGGGSDGAIIETKPEDQKTFADVAGCQEAIDELMVVKKKIKRPRLYRIFGAPVPSGIILYGPPGTGKTLLARALAGEVGGSFWAMSGSQFVEMYVGVGAKRVREAYAQARAAARKSGRISIVFIDEIDAIGKKRGSNSDGGNREYEQTLNQLLVEMDGFGNRGLVLTMAATNRLDILDDALLRPGRFDIKVQIPKPDRKGRRQIFDIYLKKHKLVLAGNDDEQRKENYERLLDDLSRRSHDFSGAEIEAAIKDSATIAVERQFGHLVEDITEEEQEEYRKKAIITADDLNLGIDKMAYGTQIKSRVRTDKERKATAVHEIGHAAVPTVDENGDKVNRITIVMTDKSLGLMDSSPEEGERYDWTKEQFIVRLKTMLAGRAAEKIILGKISTGASNDFERASMLARQMVGVYGMSEEFGVKSIPLDQAGFPTSRIGEALTERFNAAWGGIIDRMEKETDELIVKYRTQIEHCANALFEEETLTGDEFRELWAAGAQKEKEGGDDVQ